MLFASFGCSCNRGASWIILTVLFESQLSFVPLLSFSLWSKQESLFSSFSRGILVEAFWLAEASRKLLLLAWDITLSKMCVKNCVCGRFLALSFTHSVPSIFLFDAMNTTKAVSLATSAIGRYGVQTEVNRTRHSPLIITSVLST